MSNKRSPFGLLIIACLVISVLFSLFQVTHVTSREMGPSKKTYLTIQDTIDLITPLLLSKSFDAIAQALKQFDQSVIIATLEKLVADSSYDLNQPERAQLLLNLMGHITDKVVQEKIVTLLRQQYAQDPVYSYALLEQVPQVIKQLKQMVATEYDEKWAEQSLAYAVEHNNMEMLDQLYAHNVRPTRALASQLLYNVVSDDKDVSFVPLLVRSMGANVNFSPDGKRTILIKAVENENEPMVRALVESGADPEKMVNERIGTPRQIAFEKGLIAIEAILVK